MKGKICIITGANSGLGLEAACQLAEKGAELGLICRSKEKGEIAKAAILSRKAEAKVHLFAADFSSQQQIQTVAREIHATFSHIDVLLNNAGAVFSSFALSEDGIEMTMAVNHFAYFSLTNALLDLLEKSSEPRIINVASESYASGTIHFPSFTKNTNYFVFKAYAQSKLANLLFTYELDRRLRAKKSKITVNALNPGRVKTDIGIKNQHWFIAGVWHWLTKLTAISVQEGVNIYLYLATSPEMKDRSGLYFDRLKETKTSKKSHDEAVARQLWEESERVMHQQMNKK
ncbi:MAG: SDR family oxidoreductase [Bacteroidia bacterium]